MAHTGKWLARIGSMAVLLAAPSGCLSHQYEIEGDELARLSELDPEQRGSRVRVVQQTSWSEDEVEDPPELVSGGGHVGSGGGSVHVDVHTHDHIVVVRPSHGVVGPARRVPAAPRAVRTPASPGVSSGGGVSTPASPGVPSGTGGRTPAGASGGVARTPATPGVARPGGSATRVPATSSGKTGGSAPGGGLGGGGGGDGEAAIVLAAVALATAAVTMTVVASTEGKRYDGWVALEPRAPVLIVPHSGQRYWMRLDQIESADAAAAQRAIVHDEGVTEKLGRAPLTRGGLVYELELGAAEPSVRGGSGAPAFQARAGLGGFIHQQFGALVGAQFAAGDEQGMVFNGRLFVGLEYLPLALDPVHLGGYLDAGMASVFHDAPDRTDKVGGLFAGGGLLTQLEISTRLAASVRAGAAWLPALSPAGIGAGYVLLPEASAGLAVY